MITKLIFVSQQIVHLCFRVNFLALINRCLSSACISFISANNFRIIYYKDRIIASGGVKSIIPIQLRPKSKIVQKSHFTVNTSDGPVLLTNCSKLFCFDRYKWVKYLGPLKGWQCM